LKTETDFAYELSSRTSPCKIDEKRPLKNWSWDRDCITVNSHIGLHMNYVCQQHILHPDPELKIHKVPIPVAAECKFLTRGSTENCFLSNHSPISNTKVKVRVCLGAFRTSPIPSLHVEASELPANLQREKLSLQHITKLKSDPDNPSYKCVFEPSFALLFEARSSVIPLI
jgi:hypothetical protein